MRVPFLILFFFILIATSCSKEKKIDGDIYLKWNKAYPKDTFERSVTGLKWALYYLGSTVASNSKSNGIIIDRDSIIILNTKQLGFSKDATQKLSKLHRVFKNSEVYKKNGSLDLGRYIALTFGNPNHYYAILKTPKTFEDFKKQYNFDSIKGYVDNSSVSKVNRIISFSNISENNTQGFVSAEIDSITKDTLEYETLEITNGQLKFGIYDIDGTLKTSANNAITLAGKPAKCIWCHEVDVLRLFRTQQNHDGYLTYMKFNDTLTYFNHKLQNYQDNLWTDENLRNKKSHTELELLYITFMEPSAERISNEWNMPLAEVKQKLSHLKTHVYEEFPFLGKLYHRKAIDKLAPYANIEVSESIREASGNAINLLK